MKNRIVSNISYSLCANIVSTLVSIIIVLLLPKLISVQTYGEWQLYIFYSFYLGFFHFGWLEGIYLRYGGYSFNEINKIKFSNQLYALVIFTIFIVVILYMGCDFIICSYKASIIKFVILALLPTIILTYNSIVLQIGNEIKQYAKLIIFERVTFLILIFFYFIFHFKSSYYLFCIDLISKTLASLVGIYFIKKILILSKDRIGNIIKEVIENLNVGSKVFIANISGMLTLGIIRFGISQTWDLEIFAKISLAFSIINFFMIFINAISTALFPTLKRTTPEILKIFYLKLDKFATLVMLGSLMLYIPLKIFIMFWLPEYGESVEYLSVLLPICFFESKINLIINTYLKVFRKELTLLKINLGIVVFTLLSTYYSIIYIHDINLTIFFIFIIYMFKYFISKNALLKILNTSSNYYEYIFIIIFILTNNLDIAPGYSFCIYTIFYLMYVYINKIYIIDFCRILKNNFKK